MTLTPVRRLAAAVVMTLIAVATVVSLTRSEAPATDAASASGSTDLPGIAAVAPDVDTALSQPELDPSPADLLEQSTNDLIDQAVEQSSTSRTSAAKTPVAAATATPTTSAPTTSAPTTSAPTAPAPQPAPAPSPTPKKNGLEALIDSIFSNP